MEEEARRARVNRGRFVKITMGNCNPLHLGLRFSENLVCDVSRRRIYLSQLGDSHRINASRGKKLITRIKTHVQRAAQLE